MKVTLAIITVVFCIVCLYSPNSLAEIKGSTTAVLIIPNSPVFPAADSDNTMLGFGYFQGGFTLQDATTSCTFDSVFQVSGTIDMKGGTLFLLQDLILADPVKLDGLGTIIGNDHTVEFCSSITSLPSNFSLIKDVNLVFHHDVELNSTLTIQGNCYIQCSGGTISFNNNASLVIDSGANLEIQNTILENVGNINNNTISCIDNTSSLSLNNTTIVLANDWPFNNGSMYFKNTSTIIGPHSLYYTSKNSSKIEAFSTLSLDKGVELVFGKATLNSPEPLILAEKTSTLACKQCTLHITNSGVQLTSGKLSFDGSVILETDSTDTMKGLIFGDHTTEANDLEINFGPGCNVTMQQGTLTYNNINEDGFLNSASSSSFKLNSDVIFHLVSSCTLPNNTFIIDYNGASLPTLLFDSGTALYLDGTSFNIPGVGETVYNGYFQYPHSSDLFFLITNNSIFLTYGTLIVPTKIIGTSNTIRGNGTINAPLIMGTSGSIATLDLRGSIDSTIDLNGGTIILSADTVLTATNCFLTTGTINLSTKTLTLQPISTSEFAVPIFWTGTQGTVQCTQDTTLTSTWTFMGNVVLDAGGNAIIFEGGSIVVAPGGNLTIKNAHLNNIVQNSIYCIDDTASIILYNVTWEQAKDVAFEHGALNYKNSVFMTGQDFKFTYMSTATGTVYSDTTLTLDNLFTFSYAPSNASTTLLQFTDFTSELALNHSVLYIVPGLVATKGQFTLSQKPTIYAMGEGLTLGDESITDSSADMRLVFLDTASTSIQAGSLNYMNLKGSSLQMWAGGGLNFQSASSCKAYQTIDAGTIGTIIFEYQAQLYTKQTPGCPNISDVIGDRVYNKPDPINLCS
jgi:hypothetical protein